LYKNAVAGSDSFGVEQRKASETVEWMNEHAKKNNQKFEAKLEGYSIETVKFGAFEMISWKGDWATARSIIKKASGKVGAKVLESGYHQKQDLITSMFTTTEYAKVYSNGRLAGQVELGKKSGKWVAKSESFA
jgi:hypothetical protein